MFVASSLYISSPFSIEAVDLLLELGVDTIKIPSGEVSNLPLLDYIAKTSKKILLSSGMSSWEELDTAVNIFKGNNELVVLQCTSEYPCLPENSGINLMVEMRQRYNCNVGFSDHTLGIAVPIAAVAFGAKVIEKHFTLSKHMYGSDAKNSIEPAEFRQLVLEIRATEKAICHKIDKDEKINSLSTMKLIFEKSIVAKNDLNPGHIIQNEDLAFKKPGSGIPAKAYKSLIGKKLKTKVKANTLFKVSDFE
jgi:N,N'-diacetyllegionaminate synthase